MKEGFVMLFRKKFPSCAYHPRRFAYISLMVDNAGVIELCKPCAKRLRTKKKLYSCPECQVVLKSRWDKQPLGAQRHAYDCSRR